MRNFGVVDPTVGPALLLQVKGLQQGPAAGESLLRGCCK
jgi:hypothetical protein